MPFSSISPPPKRGYVVRSVIKERSLSDTPEFETQRHEILGVVVHWESTNYGERAEIRPVVMHTPGWYCELDGGLIIYDNRYSLDHFFSVVWFDGALDEQEEEETLLKVEQFVRSEALANWKRERDRRNNTERQPPQA